MIAEQFNGVMDFIIFPYLLTRHYYTATNISYGGHSRGRMFIQKSKNLGKEIDEINIVIEVPGYEA